MKRKGLVLATAAVMGIGSARADEQQIAVIPDTGVSQQQLEAAVDQVAEKKVQLRNGTQVWVLDAGQDAATTLKALGADARVKEVVLLGVDVRSPFQPTSAAQDLTPAQEKQLQILRGLRTTSSVQVVKLQSPKVTADFLRHGAVGDPRSVPLMLSLGTSPAEHLALATTEVTDTPTGFAWTGEALDGAGAGDATLIVGPKGISGTIRKDRDLYSVRPLGGGLHAIIKMDQAKMPLDEPEKWTPASKPLNDARPRAGNDACHDQERRIDLVVAYTKQAALEAGDIQGLILLSERETNDSYVSSNVDGRVRVVKTLEVDYKDTGSVEADLAALATSNHPTLGPVHKELGALHADVAVLMTGASDYCGVAQTILAKGRNEGLAVVAQNCATGYYSFGHELGHLLGARHDRCVDPTDTPFAFGHGYLNGKKWRTIMGYGACCDNCTRIKRWANATVKYEDDLTGDATYSDDHRALNESFPSLAAFRCPVARAAKR